MRQTLRKVVIVVGFLMAAGLAEKAVCPNAEASYGLSDALGTVGIAAGIGTVIGLSTIAFYDSPTSHMKNALMGAGAGLLVGLGVAAYLLASSPEENDISPEELLRPEKKPDVDKNSTTVPAKPSSQNKRPSLVPLRLASVPVTSALRSLLDRPNVDGTRSWIVAVNVLELRF